MKAKWVRLVLLMGSSVLAVGGCGGGNWLPWVIGAAALAAFTQQPS